MANVLMEKSGGTAVLSKARPNQRLGKAEDIAATVVFLCSRAGGHLNGTAVVLDGEMVWGASRL